MFIAPPSSVKAVLFINSVSSKVSDEMVPVIPSAPPVLATLSKKKDLLNTELTIPASILIAPPTLFSARLLMNETSLNVTPSTFPWKLMAPASFVGTVLFSKATFSKVSDVDVSLIYKAPPLPLAKLFMKSTFVNVFDKDLAPMYNAPPSFLSVLFSNIIFSNVLFVDEYLKRIAPPLSAAVLLMKFKLVKLLLDRSYHTLIAPPHPSVFPFLNVISSKITSLFALSSKILILPDASI